MAIPFHLPPSAASLTASLRDLGYSLETAIADLVDNSIAADATEVKVFCDMSRRIPVLVISDNGRGMTEAEVISAMRHGATDPRKKRSSKDLGRFGLGLKTASFSQCRQLTVVSKKFGFHSAAEWSLAQVEKEDDWFISVLNADEISQQPFIDSLEENGTLIIWRELDRLFEDEFSHKREEIVNEKLLVVERHLALVFHRFLSGEVKGRKRLSVKINGHAVEPFDPFCRKNSATQVLPVETVWLDDEAVTMQPYILPHHSRLTASEYDYYQDRSDFISNQGAYVYRNSRLMAWGDWFRLIPKGETTKLARVQIDFSNSIDEVWTIDIKKSRARPPHAVRERLRQIVSKVAARSVNVHRGRGQKLFQEITAPLWDRYADHDGIRFSVNFNHPLVTALSARITSDEAHTLRLLLNAVGASLPVEMIYSDYSTAPRNITQVSQNIEECIETLRRLKVVLVGAQGESSEEFLRIVQSTRLFDGHQKIVEKFIKEEF